MNLVHATRKYFPVIVLVLALTSCHDHTPHLSKEQVQRAVDAWLQKGEAANQYSRYSFDEGQRGRAVVTKVYSFAPASDQAELQFTNFKYQDPSGEVKFYTGAGVVDLQQEDNKRWIIRGMSTMDAHGAMGFGFHPGQNFAAE